jgi:hypothetical protein
LVRTSGNAPVPGRHGGIGYLGIGGQGRVDHCQTGAPLEVCDEGRAEFGVGWEALLVGGLEEEGEPAFALLFGDSFAEMMLDHGGVSTMVHGIVGGSTEDFADEGGDVLEVVGWHGGEERREDGIGGNLPVEAGDESREGFLSAQPFVKGWDFGGHGWDVTPGLQEPYFQLTADDGRPKLAELNNRTSLRQRAEQHTE